MAKKVILRRGKTRHIMSDGIDEADFEILSETSRGLIPLFHVRSAAYTLQQLREKSQENETKILAFTSGLIDEVELEG